LNTHLGGLKFLATVRADILSFIGRWTGRFDPVSSSLTVYLCSSGKLKFEGCGYCGINWSGLYYLSTLLDASLYVEFDDYGVRTIPSTISGS
nr:hypothetical protein [Tanacetum cinerariifolium]